MPVFVLLSVPEREFHLAQALVRAVDRASSANEHRAAHTTGANSVRANKLQPPAEREQIAVTDAAVIDDKLHAAIHVHHLAKRGPHD